MKKTLDAQAGLRGDVRGLVGAKINADRLKAREIYRHVKACEDRLPKKPVSRINFTDVTIAALFDSYSVIAVNLLGEIWLCGNENSCGEVGTDEPDEGAIRRRINQYVESIPWMIPILKWRNKVAAHPAAIAPRPTSETPADRDISLMPTAVGEENGRYVVPAMTPIRQGRSKKENTPTLAKWSLTQNWEQLLGRFPWLDDDDFIEIGYPIGANRGLLGKYPGGLNPNEVALGLEGHLPPGSSVIVCMGAAQDGSGGLRIRISKSDSGKLSFTPMIDGKPISPSWLREGSEMLPDGTILINPESDRDADR